MTHMTDRIMAMTDEQKSGALIVLDAMTRPLSVREIEGALRTHGVPRSRAVIVAASIKKLSLIAVVGPEHG